MMRPVPRLVVLRGPTPALCARPELTPRARDLVLTPAGELPWEGVRRLVAALAASEQERVAEALALERVAASLVLRGLVAGLSPAELAARAALAAQAPGFMAHNGYVSYPLRIAFVRILAPLLAGRRVLVLGAESLDLHSAAVLLRLVAAHPECALVLALDPERVADQALWRRDALSVIALCQSQAAAEDGARVDLSLDLAAEPTAFDPAPFAPAPWDDDLDARALAERDAPAPDPTPTLAALEASWACFGFHTCLRLGLDLLARAPDLAPARRRRVHLLVALAAYNRQVSSKGEDPGADEELAALIDHHLRAALAGEDDPPARSHILYRLALNAGRRRGALPDALALADQAVIAAEQGDAPFFAAWARNGRAYILGRLGDLRGAIAEVLSADSLAARPIAGPLSGEQAATRLVLADNLAALHTWAGAPDEALRWQAAVADRAAHLAGPVSPSPRWVELHCSRGDLASAAAVAEAGVRAADALMWPPEVELFTAWLGELRYRQGDAAAARAAFERARVLAGRLHADHRDLPTRIAALLAALRSGAFAEAEVEVAEIVQIQPAAELLALAGIVAARRGDRELATARINDAIAAALEGGVRDELLRVAAAAGEACLALGDRDEASAAFAQALALADDPPAQPADLVAAIAGASAAGDVDAPLVARALEVLGAALAESETWWQLDRLARAYLRAGCTADPSLLRARLAQRRDADPDLLHALGAAPITA